MAPGRGPARWAEHGLSCPVSVGPGHPARRATCPPRVSGRIGPDNRKGADLAAHFPCSGSRGQPPSPVAEIPVRRAGAAVTATRPPDGWLASILHGSWIEGKAWVEVGCRSPPRRRALGRQAVPDRRRLSRRARDAGDHLPCTSPKVAIRSRRRGRWWGAPRQGRGAATEASGFLAARRGTPLRPCRGQGKGPRGRPSHEPPPPTAVNTPPPASAQSSPNRRVRWRS